MKKEIVPSISEEDLIAKIYFIRGKRVMLDHELAYLYSVETKQLKRAVKRNINRFPEDFMFIITKEELENLRSQFGTSSWGGIRYLPFAFTEQGVSMLSSVLNSERAIQVNIQIMRIFTKFRELLLTHNELRKRIEKFEDKILNMDDEIQLIFKILKELLPQQQNKPKKEIGFHAAFQK